MVVLENNNNSIARLEMCGLKHLAGWQLTAVCACVLSAEWLLQRVCKRSFCGLFLFLTTGWWNSSPFSAVTPVESLYSAAARGLSLSEEAIYLSVCQAQRVAGGKCEESAKAQHLYEWHVEGLRGFTVFLIHLKGLNEDWIHISGVYSKQVFWTCFVIISFS